MRLQWHLEFSLNFSTSQRLEKLNKMPYGYICDNYLRFLCKFLFLKPLKIAMLIWIFNYTLT